MVKPLWLWSRPSLPWAYGVRPNSPPQMTSVSLQQAARLQVGEQAGDRLVDALGSCLASGFLQVAVMVPAAVRHLDEAHAASTKRRASRHCRPKLSVAVLADAVERLGRRRFLATGPSPSAARSACGRPARRTRSPLRRRVVRSRSRRVAVERLDEVELHAAGRRRLCSGLAMLLTLAVGDRPMPRDRRCGVPW